MPDDVQETAAEQPQSKRYSGLKPPWGPDNPPPKSPGPQGPHLSTILKKIMACRTTEKAEKQIKELYPDLPDGTITRAHMYMAKLDEAAISGEEWALKMIFDRTEGRAQERVELSGGLKNELEIDPAKLSPEELAAIRKVAYREDLADE
jgi:hypothetical protein